MKKKRRCCGNCSKTVNRFPWLGVTYYNCEVSYKKEPSADPREHLRRFDELCNNYEAQPTIPKGDIEAVEKFGIVMEKARKGR